jgi:hypothetical protein
MGRLGYEKKPYTTLQSLKKHKATTSSPQIHTYKIDIRERLRSSHTAVGLHPTLLARIIQRLHGDEPRISPGFRGRMDGSSLWSPAGKM